jgi:hypothetical protein
MINKMTEIYTHVSYNDREKIKSPLDSLVCLRKNEWCKKMRRRKIRDRGFIQRDVYAQCCGYIGAIRHCHITKLDVLWKWK